MDQVKDFVNQVKNFMDQVKDFMNQVKNFMDQVNIIVVRSILLWIKLKFYGLGLELYG